MSTDPASPVSSRPVASPTDCGSQLPDESAVDMVSRINHCFDTAVGEHVKCQLWWSDVWVEVPTVLARAIRLRAVVEVFQDKIELSVTDSWTDFWIRLCSLFPKPELLDQLQQCLPLDLGHAVPVDTDLSAQLNRDLAVAAATANLVNQAPPRVHDVAIGLLGWSAQRANSALQENPTLHMAAVQLLRRGNVLHYPYQILNAGLARSLVVAYGFPPYTDTSGLVFARRVYERNEVVDVISKDVGSRARLDPSSLAIAAEFVASHQVIGGPIAFDRWDKISDYVSQALAIAEPKLNQGKYLRLYSRAMWPASHFLAALIKLKWPAVHWVAEFSDPMRRDVHNRPRHAAVGAGPLTEELAALLSARGVAFPGRADVYAWTEDLPYRLADELLFTNEHQLQFMTSYLPQPVADAVQGKATVEHHPTPPARYYRRSTLDIGLDEGKVNIGYFGVFYRTRGLGPVIDALASLSASVRQRLAFNVFCPDPQELTAQVADRGLDHVVVARPYLAYFDFLKVITELDCLLVDDYQTSQTHPINPYLPSKWSDYVGSGTPIWRLTEAGSVLSSMRSAYQSDMGDVAGAARVLQEIAEFGSRRRHPGEFAG